MRKTSGAIFRGDVTLPSPGASASLACTRREDNGRPHNYGIYIVPALLISGVLLSQPSRHNCGSYWTGNGGRARPITVPGNLPMPLKSGRDFPRHIRHLLRRLLRKNGDHPRNSRGGRPARWAPLCFTVFARSDPTPRFIDGKLDAMLPSRMGESLSRETEFAWPKEKLAVETMYLYVYKLYIVRLFL